MSSRYVKKFDGDKLKKDEDAYEGAWRPGKKGCPPEKTRPHELLSEENRGFVLSDLYTAHDKYTAEEKISAATAMMITGNSQKSSKITGIPASTIRWWANESSWWPSLMKKVRKDKNEELDAVQTDILHKTLGKLQDRVENGDAVITKDGDVAYKEVSARDLATVHGIIFDKRALNRGDPTSKSERSDTDAIQQMARQFEKFAKQLQDGGALAKPIEGEVIDNG